MPIYTMKIVSKHREVITAAVTERTYGKVTVNPVNNILRWNRYYKEKQEGKQESSDFSGILERELKERTNKKSKKQEKLRILGGLNQYDRYAHEFCFLLSRETDYKV